MFLNYVKLVKGFLRLRGRAANTVLFKHIWLGRRLSLSPSRPSDAEFKEVLLTARVPATLCFTRLEMRAVVSGRSPLPLEAGLADTSSRHVVAVAVKTRAAQEAAAVPKRPVGAGRLAPGETERRQ